jgi:hypothetical protein
VPYRDPQQAIVPIQSLRLGADVNSQCGRHGNALNAALRCNCRGRHQKAVADLLYKHGAVQQGIDSMPTYRHAWDGQV